MSAAQLNNKFDTLATAIIWMPTTGEFGKGFGDFEDHQQVATRLAGHFTRSNEDTQEQNRRVVVRVLQNKAIAGI